MTDSITRDGLKIKLTEACYQEWFIEKMLNLVFPPKFVPKYNQVVRVWNRQYPTQLAFDKFQRMSIYDGRYTCVKGEYDACKPLTDNEITGIEL